jgi:hypothetical protein
MRNKQAPHIDVIRDKLGELKRKRKSEKEKKKRNKRIM